MLTTLGIIACLSLFLGLIYLIAMWMEKVCNYFIPEPERKKK